MGLGVVGEVLQPGGVESVGSEEVTTTLHEHFRAQFAAEGGHWHTDKEVAGSSDEGSIFGLLRGGLS